jgi:hypothetical protein
MSVLENALLASPRNRESKVYMVCVRKVGPEAERTDAGVAWNALYRWEPARIDHVLNSAGDWLRYNTSTWFVFTQLDCDHVSSMVRQALSPSDSVLVIRAEPSEFGGWAPPDVWDWLQSKRPQPSLANYLRDHSKSR